MNTSADAADQVVRMSLNGAEVALKVSGKGAKEITVLLAKALKSSMSQSNRTKGSIRLQNLVRSGKKLSVTEVKDDELKSFCEAAKKYGILYTILKDRSVNDGKTELMYKSEDEEKIRRIFKKHGMFTVDMAEVKDNVVKDMSGQPAPERYGGGKEVSDDFMSKLMEKANPTKEEGQSQNPPLTRTESSGPSVSSSKQEEKRMQRTSSESPEPERRRSVRKELKEIREEQERARETERKRTPKTPARSGEHKAPPKKKREKER